MPPVLAASWLGTPTLIHDANAVIGRANRFLAPRVTAIATTFPDVFSATPALAAKATLTGNPVRPAVIAAATIPFPAALDPLHLLVFGGSQGARIMADIVPAAIGRLDAGIRNRLSIVQQAREEDMARVREAYARLTVAAEVAPFFTDLPARMAASHLVVSRSGASTVAELAAIGRPSILVPLPHALDQDQFANAGVLEAAGAAIRLVQSDFTPERLAAEIAALRGEAAAPCRHGGRGAIGRPARRRRSPGRSGAEGGGNQFEQVISAPSIRHGRACFARYKCCHDEIGVGGSMRLPRDIGPIHFIGIGGIGMSGIAEVLVNLGYKVQGSDQSDGANVKRLRDMGVAVAVGHDGGNIADAKVVVVSSAIKRDNPELAAARAQRIPVVRRAEMLAELMRLKSCVAIAGTHGKTTTTSMVAALLDAGNFDPTVINGGIINAYGTNARLGAGDWMVVEADESDGTFLKLPADIAIVTNVDPEHLDHFGTFDAVQDAFRAFVENVPFYGFSVMCTDHAVVQSLVGRIEDHRIVTYGENPQADVRLLDVSHAGGASLFTILFRDRAGQSDHEIKNLTLPMPGRHNALNATAAVAVAHALGIGDDVIRNALAGFGGVRRRFTRTGIWNGVTIIDDYGHHPVEIAAVLKAARESTKGQVIAVVQPHRYTRLAALFEQFCTCFNDADAVIVAPVYPAGEAPIEGINRDSLVQGLITRGHRNAVALDGPPQLAGLIRDFARSGDYVVCLGAGSITQWAYALPGELAAAAS